MIATDRGSALNKRDAGLLLLALAWLALTIGMRPLALPDEGRYVGVAWEMLTSGNWLYPTLNGLPFFHKPPLFYWITAASLGAFGTHEWAARLAPLLGAEVAVLSLYGFALRQQGRSIARGSLLILVTQPFFFAGAQFANLDMLVAGFISATIVLGAEAVLNAEKNKPYRGALAGAYLCAGLGILAKGLIGAVLPGLVIVIWLAWNRRLTRLRELAWWPGVVLFLLVAAPWFVAMQARFPDFLNYFFVYNHFQRFAEGGFNNPMPFWFYLPVIILLIFPWSGWLPAAWKQTKMDAQPRPTIASLMWIWPAAIVGFFSIPSSKIVGYVLPVLPPLAYLIAIALERRWSQSQGQRFLKGTAVAAGLICLSAIVAVTIFNKKTDKGLSRVIAAQRVDDEPVLFVRNQFFDVPFYLRLKEPVRIFDDWSPSNTSKHDNWRKAVADAGKFDPEKARQLLLDATLFERVVCSHPVSWVIAMKGTEDGYPLLKQIPSTATHEATSVWRLSRKELVTKGGCQQMPNDDSVGKLERPHLPG
jgi:4-amino-4-deoxy-L-arabinose transferase-like glycosyltransferase